VERNSGDESSASHATSPFSGASSPGSVSGGNGGGGGSSKGKETARLGVPRTIPVSTVSAVQPPRPSWEECLNVASVGGRHYVRFVALHTQLNEVSRRSRFPNGNSAGYGEMSLGIPPARKPDNRFTSGREEFHLRGQCLIHLSQSDSGRFDRSLLGGDGICLFLYEVS
jgi:hypothetical protein